ncbi:MAG: efflux RND transporter periplasmic adaptor subunit [Anaerolineae bacterium]|nr:efflux RND transporter periplasmic adaptor subunit [Anaerolineae bacterium]
MAIITRRINLRAALFLPLGFILAQSSASWADSLLPTLAITYQQAPTLRWFDGVLEAQNQATISSQVSARVMELPYDVDDYVEKGAVIVRFRDVDARAGLEKALASLKEAEARLTEAETDLHRIKGLYERQLISKADLDRATANTDAAQARFAAAKANQQQAQESLDNTVVRAPYSGVVVARLVQVGELASPGQPLMTGRSLEQLRAAVEIPQAVIQSVREAEKISVQLPSGEMLNATSVRIFPWANETSHTFRVRLNLPEGQHGVYPGMWVKVAVNTGSQPALFVPASAITHHGEIAAVYIKSANGWAMQQVRVGEPDAQGRVQVYSGLSVGDEVAVDALAASRTRITTGARHE